MIYPKSISSGASVGLIAPGSPVTPEERRNCEKALRMMGFSVITGESLKRDADLHGYLAGNAVERAGDINHMFANSEVEAVFCVRGGYGSSMLLPYLDYALIRRNPKIFVGYSDVTSLHTVLQKFCSLVTFHGPMGKPDFGRLADVDAYGRAMDREAYGSESEEAGWEKEKTISASAEYMLRSLYKAFSGETTWDFENPPGEQFKVLVPGCAHGILTGGNLSVLARSLGTPYAPETVLAHSLGTPYAQETVLARSVEMFCTTDSCDKILFLEDIGENIPRIHMYLTQMQYAGIFCGVRGILLGDFTECGGSPKEGRGAGEEHKNEFVKKTSVAEEGRNEVWTVGRFLADFFKPLRIPVIGNVCSDHRYPMGTLPLGAYCRVQATEQNATLTCGISRNMI